MIYRRLRLRRADGAVYLDRWGLGVKRLGAVFLHRMDAPDPGCDLHDHPWSFVSLVLAGGYTEERALAREASTIARFAARCPGQPAGLVEHRARWSFRLMRLDEAHRITALDGRRTWTLVLCGPVRRTWGFFLPSGWRNEKAYDETVRAARRDMWNERG